MATTEFPVRPEHFAIFVKRNNAESAVVKHIAVSVPNGTLATTAVYDGSFALKHGWSKFEIDATSVDILNRAGAGSRLQVDI